MVVPASSRRLLTLAAASGVIVACSTSSAPSPPNSVTGTVGGSSFTAGSAVTETLSASHIEVGVEAGAATLEILVYSTASTCSAFHNANAAILEIGLPADVAAGDSYKVVAPPSGFGSSPPGTAPTQLERLDASCSGSADPATGGTVEITSRSGTTIVGSVHVDFTDGSLSGSFSASVCAADGGGSTGTCG
jgi:hypothetical protein